MSNIDTTTTDTTTIAFTASGTVANTPDGTIDWESMYKAKAEETERLSAVLAATRASTPATDPQSLKPKITADRAKALAGPAEFLRMTRDQKIQSVGGDPKSVSDEGLRKLFGRGADFQLASDLARSNPAKYALLKQCALITGAYGM